jgi:hypothetical protein
MQKIKSSEAWPCKRPCQQIIEENARDTLSCCGKNVIIILITLSVIEQITGPQSKFLRAALLFFHSLPVTSTNNRSLFGLRAEYEIASAKSAPAMP